MKMLKKETEQRQAIEMLCTDMLVPKGHLLRKIDAAVDFTHIYELVEDLYSEDNGRPSCDPVVLFKLVLIQHLFGIRSLRQTMRDAEVNVAEPVYADLLRRRAAGRRGADLSGGKAVHEMDTKPQKSFQKLIETQS